MKHMTIGLMSGALLSAVLIAGCESANGHEGAVIGGAAGAVAGDQLHDKNKNQPQQQ